MHGRTLGLALLALLASSGAARAETRTFSFTGSVQTFTVPDGVTSLVVTLDGAQGGTGCLDYADAPNPAAPGGRGAHVVAPLDVTPGLKLAIRVGGQGGGFGRNGVSGCSRLGGYNGGGGSGPEDASNGPYVSGGGGGASDIRVFTGGARSVTFAGNRLAVAGGGGGGAGQGVDGSNNPLSAAGAGGDSGAPGADGADVGFTTAGKGGGAGTDSAPGAGGDAGEGNEFSWTPGSPGTGGTGGILTTCGWSGGCGGGGGGGLYGGGSGGTGGGDDGDPGAGGGGGGGGSSATQPGGTITEGARSGDGLVTITWTPPAPEPPTETPAPVVEPPAPVVETPPVTDPGQVLLCEGREVALIDLRRSGRFVVLRGVALTSMAGRRVRISGDHGAKGVTVPVGTDGSFTARVPRPRSSQTSYTAILGDSRSAPLKMTRNLTVVSKQPVAGGIRIVARHSKGARVRGATATLRRQSGCGVQGAAATATFDRRGRVSFLLPAPVPPDTIAVYRVTTKVNNTFTLPIVVRP